MPAGVAPVSLNEAKAFLRLETDAEDALIAGMIRAATDLCEAFTGQVTIAGRRQAVVPADGQWHRLPVTPVRRLVEASGLGPDGGEIALPFAEIETQIDMCGDGVGAGAGAADRRKGAGRYAPC